MFRKARAEEDHEINSLIGRKSGKAKKLEWPHAPGIWDDKHVEKWKDIVDAVHEAGIGREAHPDMPQHQLAGTPVYAPSAIKVRGGKFRTLPGTPGYVTPTAIDDPRKIIAQFKDAAINAKKAGFDGVELIGNGGYIVHEFLDNTSNHRTDEWGGSKENCFRFASETLKALQEVFGKNIGLKITPTGGYNDMGMPLDETLNSFSYYFSELDKLGLAYIILMRYTPILDVVFDGGSRATKHDVLLAYRPFIKNTLLFLNGRVTPEEGAELLASGQIDAITLGFSWITHPDLVEQLEQEKPLDNELDI
ncbi:hypothetical protein CPB84DRAFT_1871668 [Gymnopilus junonius]|uniref:NADH:flavin oxidoreductase/NADH oxidase N-terminal domain-containing protein n=1 Tax=Gymnopilus junonius TaxID=109634 RepID=A0A9P5NEV8_GYMJU|nr:hypothetical protein CPB84DRAFT_1871668 [Gymnopilus junonius]